MHATPDIHADFDPAAYRQYLTDCADSPYGETLNGWEADAHTLYAVDSDRLDESAQIARSHATIPARANVAATLLMFAQDCDIVRNAR